MEQENGNLNDEKTVETQNEEKHNKNYKNIIGLCALILCVLFFTMPLVQCSQGNSKNASGWEIAIGTGDLFSQGDKGYPAAFILLLIPIVLLIMAFIKKSFSC